MSITELYPVTMIQRPHPERSRMLRNQGGGKNNIKRIAVELSRLCGSDS